MKTKQDNKKFIDAQLENMLEEGKKLSKNVSESKETFANNITNVVNIDGELVPNDDYFDKAFKKIDADRINEQLEAEKQDETETVEDKTVETHDDTIDSTEFVKQAIVEEHKVPENSIKKSFFDRLLELL